MRIFTLILYLFLKEKKLEKDPSIRITGRLLITQFQFSSIWKCQEHLNKSIENILINLKNFPQSKL